MAVKDLYGVQSFQLDRTGKLTLGQFQACKDADEARRLAAKRVERGQAMGAAAFCRSGMGEFGEEDAVAIATFGRVPPSVLDALPF